MTATPDMADLAASIKLCADSRIDGLPSALMDALGQAAKIDPFLGGEGVCHTFHQALS